MYNIIISTVLASLLSLTINAQDGRHHYEQIDSNGTELSELMKALKDKPDEEASHYNLAIHYYNKGVYIIENMDYEAGFESNFETQEQVKKNFSMALPYADKAHNLNPKSINTIRMLSGIYFGMNDMEKHDYYQNLMLETIPE
jgi:hypothetical protein